MAIRPADFFEKLTSHGVEFFTGVPDSLLKEFCLCIDSNISKNKHIIAANEGNAIALASGYHLATQTLPLVYMQNSGLGNAINPLLSLCDTDVYSIPLLVMIGWRGEPGCKDEPQHIKQGKVQKELLDAMELPYEIISKDDNQFGMKISKAVKTAKKNNTPFILLIKKGAFDKYNSDIQELNKQKMSRETALEIILDNVGRNTIIVSTTGKTSREIFEIREKKGKPHKQDFLTVGSMGHCSSIAMGIALAKPHRKVVCIDGDGAMLMHLGSLTTIGALKPKNFYHILINNEAHESVGGQETAAKNINLSAIVDAIGSSKIFIAKTPADLELNICDFISCVGPSFLEVKVKLGSRSNLGRPNSTPLDNKNNFMKFLEK